MINITSIRSCDGGEGVRIVALTDDCVKNTLTVSADDFLKLGTVKGYITDEEFKELQAADKSYAANRAAVRILSAGQCSKKKLYEKLRRRGFTHECAKNAAENAASRGYIDEQWQIESYIRELVEKRHIGRRKVVPMLLSKGYSGDKISAVLDEKYTDKDFALFRQRFLEKKFGKTMPDNREEAEEMKRALYKQGY